MGVGESDDDEEVNDGRRWLLAVSRETGPAGAVHGIQCKAYM